MAKQTHTLIHSSECMVVQHGQTHTVILTGPHLFLSFSTIGRNLAELTYNSPFDTGLSQLSLGFAHGGNRTKKVWSEMSAVVVNQIELPFLVLTGTNWYAWNLLSLNLASVTLCQLDIVIGFKAKTHYMYIQFYQLHNCKCYTSF